jgi:uncharacterized small protein (DUF1192 family)
METELTPDEIRRLWSCVEDHERGLVGGDDERVILRLARRSVHLLDERIADLETERERLLSVIGDLDEGAYGDDSQGDDAV